MFFSKKVSLEGKYPDQITQSIFSYIFPNMIHIINLFLFHTLIFFTCLLVAHCSPRRRSWRRTSTHSSSMMANCSNWPPVKKRFFHPIKKWSPPNSILIYDIDWNYQESYNNLQKSLKGYSRICCHINQRKSVVLSLLFIVRFADATKSWTLSSWLPPPRSHSNFIVFLSTNNNIASGKSNTIRDLCKWKRTWKMEAVDSWHDMTKRTWTKSQVLSQTLHVQQCFVRCLWVRFAEGFGSPIRNPAWWNSKLWTPPGILTAKRLFKALQSYNIL